MAASQASDKKVRQRKRRPLFSFSPTNYLALVIGMVVVVCLSVGLVLSYSSESLTAGQRWFLIGFLGLFSLFSVLLVAWLVIRHSRQLAIAEFDKTLEWRISSAEKQKRRLNVEVRELAKTLNSKPDQLADLRGAYVVAEDLALRKVQNEAGLPVMRKVSVGAADFDGLMIERDLVVLMNVVFLVRPEIHPEKVKRLMRDASLARNHIEDVRTGSRIRLLLLLVTQLDQPAEAKLRSTVVDYFRSTPVDVDIRWMDFQRLQKLYSDE